MPPSYTADTLYVIYIFLSLYDISMESIISVSVDPSRPFSSRLQLNSLGCKSPDALGLNCPENLAPIIFSETFPAVWVVKLVVRRCETLMAATLPIRNSHQLQVNGSCIWAYLSKMMVHRTFHVCRRPMVALMFW